jgi:sulfate transport system substrate-binding protein
MQQNFQGTRLGFRRNWAMCLMVALLLFCNMGCGTGAIGDSSSHDRLTLGAFSVTREVFHDGLIPAFQKVWLEKTGGVVKFEESYLASGALSRAIGGGFDADVAVFSLDPDVEPLVKAGLVDKSWNSGPTKGRVTRSLVVIGHRPDNPKAIHDWEDLAKPEVPVVYADPKTSGGARWNILAVAAGGYWPNSVDPKTAKMDPVGAEKLLNGVQKRVTVMDGSGRQSLATFLRDSGDAIITYESDVVQCERLTGRPMPYVIPPRTLWIEIPAVEVVGTTKRNGRSELAKAFLAFLNTEEAAAIWARYGFRPATGKGEAEGLPPVPKGVVTVTQLGGWKQAREAVFGNDGLWSRGFLKDKPKAGNQPKASEKKP